MTINVSTSNIKSRHWLRMPVPDGGENEMFVFTGIAVYDGIKGTGSSWERGTARIEAPYQEVVPSGKAIQFYNWAVDVHLSSILTQNSANNAGWAVDEFNLQAVTNYLNGERVFLDNGFLRIKADVAVLDIGSYIFRLSYRATILGKVVNFRKQPEP